MDVWKASLDDISFINDILGRLKESETELEEFVADFLCSFLFTNPGNVPYVDEQKVKIDEFVKTLKYHLAYRSCTAQNFELMLLAFGAGRGYQYSVDYQE